MALSQADQWTLIFWQIWRSDIGGPLRWARSLKTCIDEVNASNSESAAAIFWIRLYGAIHDFHEHFAPTPPTPPPSAVLDPDEEQALAEDEYFADLAADVRTACTGLLGAFSQDELLTIQWKRDHEAHPFLSGYELREQNGALKHGGKHGLVGNVAHRDVHEAVKRVRAGREDLAVARELAQRVVPHVEAIVVKAHEQFPKS
jgi:hypothetical protein